MRNKLIIGALIIAALSGIIIYGYTQRPGATATDNANAPVSVDVAVIVDTGSGSTTYAVNDLTNATAFSALQAAATTNGFVLDFDPPGQYGVFVKGIAGTAGTAERFWIYQVNGAEGQVAADQMTLTNGDAVTWKYTSSSAN